ncbi:g362 [Yersinia phage phiR1-37]|uniref:hypothetical protein n=1 Tax=Yersinia phage phiR1-37 TaxID=331278 RepID=UPI00022DBE15|nr:hypothetical protein phiR1-37_gp362 [Yersinia phage phiR1-37]CCE26385.1 g362 [Yersinia phage phiR1-37]
MYLHKAKRYYSSFKDFNEYIKNGRTLCKLKLKGLIHDMINDDEENYSAHTIHTYMYDVDFNYNQRSPINKNKPIIEISFVKDNYL